MSRTDRALAWLRLVLLLVLALAPLSLAPAASAAPGAPLLTPASAPGGVVAQSEDDGEEDGEEDEEGELEE